MEDSVREWNTALTAVQNMGKTAKEIDLNNMNNFLNNNQNVKKYFDSIIQNGGNAEEKALSTSDIVRLLFVSSTASVALLAAAAISLKYWIKDSFETPISSRLRPVSLKACNTSSANAGDDYVSLHDYLEKAKDLYDKGLVGTDDFKSVAELISYNIDSSTESFKKNYDKLQRYFTEDDDGNLTSGGVNNFLEDLKSLKWW